MDRCRTYKGVFIPGCMGAAVHGKEGCTCESISNESIIERVYRLEERIAKLERSLSTLRIKKLKTGEIDLSKDST